MATNVKYLKENNLFEAHKHFMRLSEAYIPTVLPEEEIDEDGEDMQDPNAMGGQDPNGMGGADPMGGGGMPQDPNAMGGQDPNAMGGDMNNPMAGDPNATGGADPMGGGGMPQDPNAMGGADPMSDMGMNDPMGEDPMSEESEDDGETIDIDGLTKAQDNWKRFVKSRYEN